MPTNKDGVRPSRRALAVLVSFEGPDPYSRTGGLGVRVTGLAESLARSGTETHLFFIGDPLLPPIERRLEGRLVLHRWGQWISAHHPDGVYDGEEGKRRDLARSLPLVLAEEVIRPAVRGGRIPLILSEDWQTADFACELSDVLHAAGLRSAAHLYWNANHPYGFDRINWGRLAFTNRLLVVSQYMRYLVRARGADSVVIPNGIPRRLLESIDARQLAAMRAVLGTNLVLFKMARWEAEKGWAQALDAVVELRRRGRPVVLVARAGGTMGSGTGISADARGRGLRVVEFHEASQLTSCGFCGRSPYDLITLAFPVDERLARLMYAGAFAVLANSVQEPFGLVGLEAMAAGGLVCTGGTGEDYAVDGSNSIVLTTLKLQEVADRLERLWDAPEHAARLRSNARQTAVRYTWDRVTATLLRQLELDMGRSELGPAITPATGSSVPTGPALVAGPLRPPVPSRTAVGLRLPDPRRSWPAGRRGARLTGRGV